jgi:hypothetical protein
MCVLPVLRITYALRSLPFARKQHFSRQPRLYITLNPEAMSMKQRELTDDENITWTCVQAFAGVGGKAAAEATSRTESAEGTVTVVCTPSGQAQTVRLELPATWLEETSDEELRAAILAQRKERGDNVG